MNFNNVEGLISTLNEHGVDFTVWRKKPEDLLKEIDDGETVLKVIGGVLERHTNSVFIEVISPDGFFRLVEDRQEFRDGRVVRRGLKEIAEKHTPDENPYEAAKRALKEELFSDIEFDESILAFEPREEPEVPTSVPTSAYDGLKTVNNITRFKVQLPPELYRKDGYIEVQAKKTNYMVWEAI